MNTRVPARETFPPGAAQVVVLDSGLDFSRTSIFRVFLFALSTSACEQTIDPLAPTEMAFSIFGHLDVSSDVQWIRVGSFRTTIFTSADPVDGVVTIENLDTGELVDPTPVRSTWVSGNFGDSLYAYNFRTTELFRPESTYRLTAVRSDGNSSSVTVRTPPDFLAEDSIVMRHSSLQPSVRFRVPPGAHLAMVQTREILVPEEVCSLRLRYNYIPAPLPPIDVGGVVEVDLHEPIGTPPEGCFVGWREIRIVLSGEAWPFDPGNDNTHIRAVNNIENGVGYLGGVLTKDIPVDPPCSRVRVCESAWSTERTILYVTVVNGSPPGMAGEFSPAVKRVSPEILLFAGRPAISISEPGTASPTFRFASLGTWAQRIRIEGGFGYYCEDRVIQLPPGEHHMEVTVIPRALAPGEPTNVAGCREG